ncbi:MAG: hydrogenase accessory protein HypB [Thiomonas sp. 14-66-4]|jgi:hydrogenase nickel incorporation protein HypB|uniref:Hydrogenase maturation factor HypB n=1 Tax=Thiomonas delicata TaxID=364030 RepID=A0A238D175_THIDL|nr:hydrogenase nickel incorporation protein HypB [Thiomonas delicata]OZB54864.1 MAG: hydrogenase accessory protein HypB [Thiomonas sp. 14-66-4]SBP87013.1 GTP hydrolase involved in nickel liganding into hydrogenases [Thiomonas delicata]
MCTVCGCSEGEARVSGQALAGTGAVHHPHHHHDHDGHGHDHDHPHDHAQDHHDHTHAVKGMAGGANHHYGNGPAGAHAPGLSQSRMVQIEQDILSKNDSYARDNRRLFQQRGILALNLVSSPGSGKTTLLTRTLTHLRGEFGLAVIEGDQETSLDAERIRATGVPSVQVNTGKGCHLDAHMVGHAISELDPQQGSVLFIENVGNLVCPAAFDLGEAHKVAILSVTEGEDKPLKYPDMFHAADVMLINKIDLLPHLDFDVERCIDAALQINPDLQILLISARNGEGLDAWHEWLRLSRRTRLIGRPLPLRADAPTA